MRPAGRQLDHTDSNYSCGRSIQLNENSLKTSSKEAALTGEFRNVLFVL
jgi:hypothetical protein